MKIVSTKENLLKATSLAVQVVGPRPNLPVLGNFLLKTTPGTLEITATNLETTISIKTPVKVEEAGEITIPARTLVDLCQIADGEKILLETEKEKLLVKIGQAAAALPTMNSSEFPPAAGFVGDKTLEIKREVWLQAVSEVVFCAAPEGGRPVLSGVLLSAENEALDLVATDGYRLAKREIKVKGSLQALVPSRSLQEAAKTLAAQEDETVEISTDESKNQLRLKTKDLTITSRLLEGDFPNYEQIMPTSFVAQVKSSTKELVEAIKLAALFAREVGNVVRLETKDSGLTICASTAQVGEAETTIAANNEGEKTKIAFNSRFLLESLSAIKEKEVTLSLSGATSAAIIRGVGNQSLLYLVMPVRTQS